MTEPQRFRRKSEIVTAVQFDPSVTPWPEGVKEIRSVSGHTVYRYGMFEVRKGDYFIGRDYASKQRFESEWEQGGSGGVPTTPRTDRGSDQGRHPSKPQPGRVSDVPLHVRPVAQISHCGLPGSVWRPPGREAMNHDWKLPAADDPIGTPPSVSPPTDVCVCGHVRENHQSPQQDSFMLGCSFGLCKCQGFASPVTSVSPPLPMEPIQTIRWIIAANVDSRETCLAIEEALNALTLERDQLHQRVAQLEASDKSELAAGFALANERLRGEVSSLREAAKAFLDELIPGGSVSSPTFARLVALVEPPAPTPEEGKSASLPQQRTPEVMGLVDAGRALHLLNELQVDFGVAGRKIEQRPAISAVMYARYVIEKMVDALRLQNEEIDKLRAAPTPGDAG